MVNVNCGLILIIIVMAGGCSADAAKRTTYETLQNVREQECRKNPSLDCEKREHYEDYRRKRDSLESNQ